MTMPRRLSIVFMAIASICIAATAATFSTMNVDEISMLLTRASESAMTASAKDAANAMPSEASLPLQLNAQDMVTKIYGVIPVDVDKHGCIDGCVRLLGLAPEDDCGALWLDADAGYCIDYYGMKPEVTALASYGDNSPDDASLSDFGYFFLFPYDSASRSEIMRNQAEFCGNLLQEMYDIGMPLEVNEASSDLFEVLGSYDGNNVDVRLLDDRKPDMSGRYILVVSVEPDGPQAE